MDAQAIFNKVWDHFVLNKGKPSFAIEYSQHEYTKKWAERTKCKYRGPNGEKCAAGLFIEDGAYDPSMEGKGITKLLMEEGVFGNITTDPKDGRIKLLCALQRAHDSAVTSAEFHSIVEQNLRNVAEDFKLNIP